MFWRSFRALKLMMMEDSVQMMAGNARVMLVRSTVFRNLQRRAGLYQRVALRGVVRRSCIDPTLVPSYS